MSTQTAAKVELKIPAQNEYVGVARLAIAGVASRLKFTVDEIEDIKIAFSEACANAVQYAYGGENPAKTIDIACDLNGGVLHIEVTDHGKGFDYENPPKREESDEAQLGLGITFMKSLMDEVKFEKVSGGGTKVTLVKKTKN